MARSEKQRYLDWAKTRQKGKTRFIVVQGALGWGIPTAVLWWVLMRVMSNTNANLPIALILFPVGGLFWGWWVWHMSERWFKRMEGPPDA
ncbi:MAG: hypothetical protein EA342_17180 [Leptolyngbya sp. LCM1.Bin17]|nr:MAG: hypothetical protein EA342_17180 [Leptolyngbya sp. LCM1.Bin17]